MSQKQTLKEALEKIEDLEKIIDMKTKEIEYLRKEFHESQGRLKELRLEKKELEEKVTNFELLKMDLELKKVEEIYNQNNKIQHRIHITKELLEEKREEVITLQNILKDFEEFTVWDHIKGVYPESYIAYKNK